jgi:hypothetical protein
MFNDFTAYLCLLLCHYMHIFCTMASLIFSTYQVHTVCKSIYLAILGNPVLYTLCQVITYAYIWLYKVTMPYLPSTRYSTYAFLRLHMCVTVSYLHFNMYICIYLALGSLYPLSNKSAHYCIWCFFR